MDSFLKVIGDNIERRGFHITLVSSDTEPRFAYTIGLTEKIGFELVLAGGFLYMANEVGRILNFIGDYLLTENSEDRVISVEGYGEFFLSEVHESWNKHMLLGVYDYFDLSEVKSFQIVPLKNKTVEIPDMSIPYSRELFPIWKYLDDDVDWDFPMPKDSTATVDMDFFYGEKIIRIIHWEVEDWEMFTRGAKEILDSEIRVIPFNVALAIDPTLFPALKLEVEEGLIRNLVDMDWQD